MTKAISRKQIEANRSNAQKSTGPRSSAGKARSGANAFKHGLTAERVLLPGETPEDFEAFRLDVHGYFAPEGLMEEQLAERAASLMWRLRRVPEFEAALFQWAEHYELADEDQFVPHHEINPRSLSKMRNPRTFSTASDDGLSRAVASSDRLAAVRKLEIGRTLDGMFSAGVFDKITRYDAALQRQLKETLKGLSEFKQQRLAK